MRPPVLAALLLLATLPSASAAWTLGPGVTIETPNVLLTFVENETLLDDDLTFETTSGPVVLDGITLDFQPALGESWAWDVLNFSLPDLFVFRGDNTAHGRLEVEGLNGIYEVSGVRGFPDFQVSHPFYNFSIPSGEQTITMAVAGADAPFEWPVVEEWLPILIWGGLLIWFVVFSAWFPAIVTLMVLLSNLADPPWINMAGGVMFVALAVILHKIAVDGILPGPWRRKE